MRAPHILFHMMRGASSQCARRKLQSWPAQAHFLVVYDRQSGRVVDFHDNQSDTLLKLYLQHTPCFHAACMSTSWTRYLTPCTASLHMPANAEPFSSAAPQSQVCSSLIGLQCQVLRHVCGRCLTWWF